MIKLFERIICDTKGCNNSMVFHKVTDISAWEIDIIGSLVDSEHYCPTCKRKRAMAKNKIQVSDEQATYMLCCGCKQLSVLGKCMYHLDIRNCTEYRLGIKRLIEEGYIKND